MPFRYFEPGANIPPPPNTNIKSFHWHQRLHHNHPYHHRCAPQFIKFIFQPHSDGRLIIFSASISILIRWKWNITSESLSSSLLLLPNLPTIPCNGVGLCLSSPRNIYLLRDGAVLVDCLLHQFLFLISWNYSGLIFHFLIGWNFSGMGQGW